jgi:cytochrome d ubiquinol oxidase subunit II
LVISILRKSANWIFAASSFLILSFFSTAIYGLYPNVLLASPDPANSVTIYNSATSAYGLRVGLIWFGLGFGLMLIYVAVMYRSFWGKVSSTSHHVKY